MLNGGEVFAEALLRAVRPLEQLQPASTPLAFTGYYSTHHVLLRYP